MPRLAAADVRGARPERRSHPELSGSILRLSTCRPAATAAAGGMPSFVGACGGASYASAGGGGACRAAAGAGALPPGWVAQLDPRSGAPYYTHLASGATQWVPPPAAAATPAAPAAPPLPPGWVAAADPTSGHTYYCNAVHQPARSGHRPSAGVGVRLRLLRLRLRIRLRLRGRGRLRLRVRLRIRMRLPSTYGGPRREASSPLALASSPLALASSQRSATEGGPPRGLRRGLRVMQASKGACKPAEAAGPRDEDPPRPTPP